MAKEQMNIRIEPEILAQLRKIAEEEGRTLSNLVEHIIRRHLAAPTFAERGRD